MANEKKIVFSESIDDSINGLALGVSFSLVSAFVLWQSDYFYFPIFSYGVGAILGIIGIACCTIEITKISKIKGIDDFILGIIFLLVWGIEYYFFDVVWLNIILFVALLFGGYGVLKGVLEIAYSFILNVKGRKGIAKNALLLLTQFFGLILTVLNILKLVGVIKQ